MHVVHRQGGRGQLDDDGVAVFDGRVFVPMRSLMAQPSFTKSPPRARPLGVAGST